MRRQLRNVVVTAENAITIAAAGGAPPLVALLMAAAGAMQNIAVHDENAITTATAGVVALLAGRWRTRGSRGAAGAEGTCVTQWGTTK